jgi:hypothetical protein
MTTPAQESDRPADPVGGAATFICGHPKSGTSLVLTLLDSHPQLVVYPEETRFFRRWLPTARRWPLQDRAARGEDWLLRMFHWSGEKPHPSQAGFEDRDYSEIGFARVRDAYRRRVAGLDPDVSQLLPAAILGYGEATGQLGPRTRRWVEKSAYNEEYTTQMFAWWPEARCLHIVRDPRDNFVSYRRKKPEWPAETFAYSWRRSIHHGWRNQRRYGGQKYMILRYEDLVSTPEEVLERIRRFLGIDDSPALRRPTRAGRAWPGNSMFGETFASISGRPVGRFREYRGEGLVADLERLLRPEMRRLGYESVSPAVGEWFGGNPVRMKWILRHLGRRLVLGRREVRDAE